MPGLERYEGDLGSCRAFLLECSLVFELQPQTYPTHKSRIAYLIRSLRGEALTWAEAVWERGSTACADYSAFTEEITEGLRSPGPGQRGLPGSPAPSSGTLQCRLLHGRVPDSRSREQLERGGSAGGFPERAEWRQDPIKDKTRSRTI